MHNQVKCFIIVIAFLALIWLIYNMSSSPIHNDGTVSTTDNFNDQSVTNQPAIAPPSIPIVPSANVDEVSLMTTDSLDSLQGNEENAILQRRMTGKNQAKPGTYKRSSFADGVRGNTSPSEWESFFAQNNQLLEDSQRNCNNAEFTPMDETNNQFASFKSAGGKKPKDEELFDVDQLLPQEVNQEWFETPPEAVPVKNRHLINISKPIGINTIGSSLKNPSYDLRGTPPNPKYVVSPWMQSSIEPDINNRGMCF